MSRALRNADGEMEMTVQTVRHAENRHSTLLVLKFAGRLTGRSAGDFEHDVLRAVDQGDHRAVTVDLQQVRYISAGWARLLLLALRHSSRCGKAFRICTPVPPLLDFFEVSGFDRIFRIVGSFSDALASLDPMLSRPCTFLFGDEEQNETQHSDINGDVLHHTPEQRHFATHWPWAALAVAKSGGRDGYLRRLDDNAANAVGVARQVLCCQGMEGCTNPSALAKRMPCLNYAVQLTVLGADPHALGEKRRRALLFEADDPGYPLPARLMSGAAQLVRDQVQFALDVAMAVDAGGSSRYAVGGLISRVLVGTDVHPETLGEPAAVALSFHEASADCIAAFVDYCIGDEDPLGAGILALARFFRKGGLTMRQLKRWSAAIPPTNGDTFVGDRSLTWPAAQGWHTHASDGAIVPVTSICDLVAAGREMDNCLARGYHHDRVAAGDMHVFKLRLRSGNAILTLREHRDPTGTHVIGYSLHELKGPRNATPCKEAKHMASRLLADLTSSLPAGIPAEELTRRRVVTRRSGRPGSGRWFCADRDVAARAWRNYLIRLPKRLKTSSLEQIAAMGREGPDTQKERSQQTPTTAPACRAPCGRTTTRPPPSAASARSDTAAPDTPVSTSCARPTSRRRVGLRSWLGLRRRASLLA